MTLANVFPFQRFDQRFPVLTIKTNYIFSYKVFVVQLSTVLTVSSYNILTAICVTAISVLNRFFSKEFAVSRLSGTLAGDFFSLFNRKNSKTLSNQLIIFINFTLLFKIFQIYIYFHTSLWCFKRFYEGL